MGLYNCSIHGLSGFVETCQHVAVEIANRRYGSFHRAGSLLVCDACLHQCGLEKLAGMSFIDIVENDELSPRYCVAYEMIEGRTVKCSECVAVAKVEQARREGRPDPFPTFDRTLNSHNKETIKELERQLTERFRFRQSVVMKDHLAMWVRAGAYTRPLTVQTYYVTDESEQVAIVDWVRRFFQRIELNQVKLEFWEAEVWEPIPPGSGGMQRGTERLLGEVYLNC